MYCNNCGKEIDDKAYICPHCGVKTKTIIQDDEPIGGVRYSMFLFPYCWLNSLFNLARNQTN